MATTKDPGLKGLRLLVVQGLDETHQPIGKPYVAADGIHTAGPGDIVYLVSKKEAAIAISKDKLIPIDECIVGFVDEYTVVERAKVKKRVPKAKIEEEIKEKRPTSDTVIKTKRPTSPDMVIKTKKPS